MVGEAITGLGIFKTLLDTAKGLNDIHDATIRNSVAIELQEKILTAYEAHAALLQRVRALEEEVASLKTWDTEKQRYELVELHGGSLAYAVKESMRGSEPPHYICASCYQQGHKSLLQGMDVYHGGHQLHCPRCQLKIVHSH
jgi:hypothetical protein